MEEQERRVSSMNSFAILVLGVVGLGTVREILTGTSPFVKADAYVLLALALLGLAWYLNGRHRLQRSAVPLSLLIIALATKIGWLIAHLSAESLLAHDLGITVMLALAILLTTNP